MIYGDGTLEALHNLICSGFPDWEYYRALLGWRQMRHRTSALSLGCYEHKGNNHRQLLMHNFWWAWDDVALMRTLWSFDCYFFFLFCKKRHGSGTMFTFL